MPNAAPPVEGRGRGMLLAFTGGFVDTLGFVALFGLFTAHITGNLVLIGASLGGDGHAGVVGKLVALPVFVLGVACTRVFQLRRERRGLDTAAPLVAVQLAGLVAFMLAGVAAAPFEHGNGAAAIGVGLVGVLAMSVQNTASRSVFSHLTPTTVMTGNLTQLVIDLVDVAAGSPDADGKAAAFARVNKAWPPVAAFGVGSLTGALGYAHAGFWVLLVPCLALAALLRSLRGRSSDGAVA